MPDNFSSSLPHAIVVMGVSGTGKSTIGSQLAETFGWAYADADNFHPPANIAKMSADIPLNDEDRSPWLDRLRDHLASHPRTVLACSALKSRYRDHLSPAGLSISFVYLHGDRELLQSRLGSRQGHYMPATLLDSQLDALEAPSSSEAIWCDVAQDPSSIVTQIITALGHP